MSLSNREYLAKHPLASIPGYVLVLTELLKSGAMCDQCGHGTRKTSKNWARCKRCGARVRRGTP